MPSISALLTDPDEFFRRQAADPSLVGPAIVVALIAAIDVVSTILQSRFTSEVLESTQFGGGGGFGSVFQVIGLIFAVAVPFVLWLLFAGLTHAVSAVFDGDGAFSTTLALVGWGFVPSVLGSAARAAIRYYRFNIRGVDVPSEMTMEAFQEFTQNLQTGPLVALIAVLGIVFTLWSAFLWTFALKHARDLDFRQAALSVALPALMGLSLSLWQLLTALEVL